MTDHLTTDHLTAAEALTDALGPLAEVARGAAWGGTPGTVPAAARYIAEARSLALDALSACHDAEYQYQTEADAAGARAWCAHHAGGARDALGRALVLHAEAYGHDTTTARMAEAVRLAEVVRVAAEATP